MYKPGSFWPGSPERYTTPTSYSYGWVELGGLGAEKGCGKYLTLLGERYSKGDLEKWWLYGRGPHTAVCGVSGCAPRVDRDINKRFNLYN